MVIINNLPSDYFRVANKSLLEGISLLDPYTLVFKTKGIHFKGFERILEGINVSVKMFVKKDIKENHKILNLIIQEVFVEGNVVHYF